MTHQTAANGERDAAIARRALLATQLGKDEVAKGVKEYLLTQGRVAFDTAVAAKAATTVPLLRLAALKK